ncbi:MAG: winged helix-turn-helix domain-containing protein [Pseudorhodoplanes sp.]
MSAPRYTFDRWTLDCARGTLTGAAGDISLRPKSFEVLRYLLQNAGRLVSRDDVLGAVWPDVTVTEESLTQCVSEVRHALGDSDQRIIKTVPRRGYLFAIAVTGEGADGVVARFPPAAEPREGGDDASPAMAPGELMIEEPSVAVLPFANLSGDPTQDYLSDGITEDVIGGLSRFSDLSVIARNSSFSYKGRSVDVRQAGRQLGVRYIVEGSVRRFDDRIRITAQLVDAQSGVQRWGERFDRALGDVFSVQDEITQSIVAIVVAHLGNAEIERVSRKPTGSWTAYDLTLRGDQVQTLAEQYWDAKFVYEARRLYAEALRIDPANPRICAKLGHTYVRAYADPTSPDLGNTTDLEHGFNFARQAVGLDPNLPLARAQLGWAYAWMRQPDAAIAEFERATALNSSFVDYRFPLILTFAGEPERALRVEHDYVRLDPFYGSMLPVIRGIALYMLKRYSEALEALRECRGRAPHVPGQAVLAATLHHLGQHDEANAVVAHVLKQLPHLTSARWPMSSVFRNPRDAEHIFDALRQAGFP